MANPRQRRKLRSGSHKPVHHSKRAKKLLKKQPPIRGPKVLQEAWDKHRTVRQNYEALGLVASLNPTASGGVEKTSITPSSNGQDMDIDSAHTGSSSVRTGTTILPKGYGRIIRDENGNILDVEIPEDEEEGTAAEAADRLIEEVPDPSNNPELASWVSLGSTIAAGVPVSNTSDTHVVQSLEELSKAKSGKTPRYSSKGERGELQRLFAKYGEDVEAMARDRKLNSMQYTAGQLMRAIKKAGGFAALATKEH